jgi:hypothetical protein
MPHAERANFMVEEFDGIVARGYVTENGEPRIAIREHGKLIWHAAPPAMLPSPLLLTGGDTFSDSLLWSPRVPTDWAGCRIFLEVAGIREVVEAIINGRSCGARGAAPYRFEVTHALAPGETNEVRLQKGSTPTPHNVEQQLSARLVAYPSVAIKL